MKTLVFAVLGVWIFKAVFEITIGLFQIIIGIFAGILGSGLWGLSFIMEILHALWQTAFSVPD